MVLKNKSAYKLIDENNVEHEVYVVSDFQIAVNNSIIIYESATGNSGVSYNNGRLNEELPINGTIVADNIIELQQKMNDLLALENKTVEFISPIKNNRRSNKYFIKSMSFGVITTDTELTFSMSLNEVREANVKQIATNLVNYQTAEFMKQFYNERIANT